MPELPEVETVRRTLKNFVTGKEIKDISIYYDKIITGESDAFVKAVKGQTIQDIDRLGKYLVFVLDDSAFVSHLRMEGKYNIVDSLEPVKKHEHITFHLSGGEDLRYQDTRKFGRLELVCKETYRQDSPLNKLGPEPWEADADEVYQRLHKSMLPVKTLLLDQTIMTGIGNIYANEICFQLGMHPETPGRKLSKRRVKELIEASQIILKEAIAQGGTTIHSFDANGITGLFQVQLNVHAQKICPLCQGEVTKKMVRGRGTYFCAKCQKRRG